MPRTSIAAETDAVSDLIGFAGDFNAVKFGILGRPRRQVGGERKFCTSFGIGLKCLADTGFWNSNGDVLLKLRPVELHPAFDLAARSFFELNEVVLNKCLRHLDERHRTCDSAVIPPIGVDRRDLIFSTSVVDPENEEISLRLHAVGDLEIEGRETTLVMAKFFSIQVNVSHGSWPLRNGQTAASSDGLA